LPACAWPVLYGSCCSGLHSTQWHVLGIALLSCSFTRKEVEPPPAADTDGWYHGFIRGLSAPAVMPERTCLWGEAGNYLLLSDSQPSHLQHRKLVILHHHGFITRCCTISWCAVAHCVVPHGAVKAHGLCSWAVACGVQVWLLFVIEYGGHLVR